MVWFQHPIPIEQNGMMLAFEGPVKPWQPMANYLEGVFLANIGINFDFAC